MGKTDILKGNDGILSKVARLGLEDTIRLFVSFTWIFHSTGSTKSRTICRD